MKKIQTIDCLFYFYGMKYASILSEKLSLYLVCVICFHKKQLYNPFLLTKS